jgi:O-glycosyl hydrolase
MIAPLRIALATWMTAVSALAEPTTVRVRPDQPRQTIEGMGGGAIFYEGHVTSLAATGKEERQQQLYDEMFAKVRTDFLHLMIRHDHEPENDNADPYLPKFKPAWFNYAKHTIAICEAAKKRQPAMQLYATLYTPPVWMKTNGDPSAGGEARATLKPGMELELGEYCWAFLAWMHRHGQTVRYLSIANEPDWPHTQPGYCLTPDSHADLFAKVAAYFDEMARRHPEVPKPALVGPNLLSAVDTAERWLPPLLERAGRSLAVVGSHDYDRRGDRWSVLTKAAKGRPVWVTEWCVNAEDRSPGLLNSAAEYWLAMTESFNGGVTSWMAYDWVYPPRPGGEALIHVDWGNDYQLTKIYHGYRQWCSALVPGMRNVPVELAGPAATGFSKPGLKAAAFLSADGKQLVVHAANVQDQPCDLILQLAGPFSKLPVRRLRTSATEDMAELPAASFKNGQLPDTLPPRAMATYLLGP